MQVAKVAYSDERSGRPEVVPKKSRIFLENDLKLVQAGLHSLPLATSNSV
jgi:hypothetical protein